MQRKIPILKSVESLKGSRWQQVTVLGRSLAQWINASVGEAENLLRFHRRTFKQFWDWQDSEVSYALLVNKDYNQLRMGTEIQQ